MLLKQSSWGKTFLDSIAIKKIFIYIATNPRKVEQPYSTIQNTELEQFLDNLAHSSFMFCNVSI